MIITRYKLLDANGNFKTVSFEGKHTEPFDFIKKSKYSNYKIAGYDVLELGDFESVSESILKDIQKFSSVHITGKVDEDRLSTDEDWDFMFFELVLESVDKFENYLEKRDN